MFSISMGGCEIVLGVEWLHTLGPITMDYQKLYMSFTQEAHTYTLHCLHARSQEIISSHRMEKLVKKGHHGVMSQFNSIHVQEPSSPKIHPVLQLIMEKHNQVFETPMELPPSEVRMITSSLSFLAVNPPIYTPAGTPFLKKMKQKK